MKLLLCFLVLLTNCSGKELNTYKFELNLKEVYVKKAISELIRSRKINKDSCILRVVFAETLTHQYAYVSPSTLKPNYNNFEPEGWLTIDGVFIIICQSGNFYKRNNDIIIEIDSTINNSKINLSSNEGAIVEPAGTRIIYCLRTGLVETDNNFYKVSDEECK